MQETAAEPIALGIGLRKQACAAIKRAITEMNIYGHPLEIRLDERQLSQDLGMSRTPVREALSVLEQEGFCGADLREQAEHRGHRHGEKTFLHGSPNR